MVQQPVRRFAEKIWLDRDVVACACPECGAPMSINSILLVQDCWRCFCIVELTEEQEEEARRLLDEVEAKQADEDIEEVAEPEAIEEPVAKQETPEELAERLKREEIEQRKLKIRERWSVRERW